MNRNILLRTVADDPNTVYTSRTFAKNNLTLLIMHLSISKSNHLCKTQNESPPGQSSLKQMKSLNKGELKQHTAWDSSKAPQRKHHKPFFSDQRSTQIPQQMLLPHPPPWKQAPAVW
jgi:hypothetical protein